MSKLDILMATVYIKGCKDVQIPIEELASYLHDNADKIESCHREVKRKMFTDSPITPEDEFRLDPLY